MIMAETNVCVFQDDFICSICWQLLKNPVTIPCGHSFCMDCITDCWAQDQEDSKGFNSCPQCRQTFTPRPVLCRNTMLTNMVGMLKEAGMQSDSPNRIYAEPGDVECGVCIGRKRKADKSCLVCLSSFCGTHLKTHYGLFPGKKHKVVEADGKLEDLICPQHDKLLEVFCRTDQKCICLQCIMDGHSGHNTVSVEAQKTEKQEELGQTQKKHKQTIQEKQKHLEELKDDVRVMKISAQAAVEDTEMIFAEMIRSIQRRCSEVTKLIRDKEKADVTQAEELMRTLEQEIAELKRRDAELERLSKTQDHTRFLQSFQSLCSLPERGNSLADSSVCTDVSFEKVTQSVSQLKDEMENLLKQGACSIRETAELISLFPPLEPLTRRDFLQYSSQLHLDPITAHGKLYISKRNQQVTYKEVKQKRPNNPERFNRIEQLLCKESVSGRHYWEVEWSAPGLFVREVAVALTSKEITRKGRDQAVVFGFNQHSWSLCCSPWTCTFIHNGELTDLGVVASPTIGVYVDHKAGILSYYSVHGDRMSLLHKIQTTFTQPLYPGFMVGERCIVSLCN